MSKYVKDLLTQHIKQELEGVGDLLLVNVVGLTATKTTELRKQLREKDIKLLVVKNSLARRATEGTQLAAAFEGSAGTLAMVWGATDIVALAKEVVRLAGDKDFEQFEARGGVMDGAKLQPEEVEQVSKWPTREEQLSILMGQVLSPGANLVSQLTSVGGALASQIEQKAEGAEDEAPAAEEAAETAAEPAAETAAEPAAEAPAEGEPQAEAGGDEAKEG
ncbi:MAG: 50S ribosomal protein L10 [Planctomycetota bacterium]|nr:MAG: 50S ribosomal protein L10 [Planctomycetota bacterium]